MVPRTVWGLAVFPGRTEVRLPPHEQKEIPITVTNDAQEKVHVSVSTKDWYVLEANRAKQLNVDKWLKVKGAKTFTLKPGQTRKIRVFVISPKEAEGELVSMVSFLYKSDREAMLNPMISVSVYMEIAGTEKVAGEIYDIVVRTWKGKLQAALDLLSTGNVHLRPTGSIELIDSQGKTAATFPIQAGRPAYPGHHQAYFADIPADSKLSSGRYTARAHLDYREVAFHAQRGFHVLKDGSIEMDAKPSEAPTN